MGLTRRPQALTEQNGSVTIGGMKLPRLMQILIGSLFGMLALLGLFMAVTKPNPNTFAFPVMMLFVGLIPVSIFEVQIRTMRKKNARVRAEVDAIAAKVFDAPALVRPGYDMSVTFPTGGLPNALLTWTDGSAFTTDGEYHGVKMSVASHVSTAGRQMGEFSHVYSHVVVDTLGAQDRFFLMNKGVSAFVSRALGFITNVPTGDPTFDALWNVSTDPMLAKDVLDDSIRARLLDLQSKVGMVSQRWTAQGGMTLILTRHGLALRWPGELNPEFTMFVRDLLLDMRTRLLAHKDRRARGGQGAGYRVFSDAPMPEGVEHASNDVDVQPRAARG